jgi:hypothetical protein
MKQIRSTLYPPSSTTTNRRCRTMGSAPPYLPILLLDDHVLSSDVVYYDTLPHLDVHR